jgi:hypothetical protein
MMPAEKSQDQIRFTERTGPTLHPNTFPSAAAPTAETVPAMFADLRPPNPFAPAAAPSAGRIGERDGR